MYPRFFLLGNLADKRKKYSSRRNNLPRTYECISASILCSLNQDDVLQVLSSVCGSSDYQQYIGDYGHSMLPLSSIWLRILAPPSVSGVSQDRLRASVVLPFLVMRIVEVSNTWPFLFQMILGSGIPPKMQESVTSLEGSVTTFCKDHSACGWGIPEYFTLKATSSSSLTLIVCCLSEMIKGAVLISSTQSLVLVVTLAAVQLISTASLSSMLCITRRRMVPSTNTSYFLLGLIGLPLTYQVTSTSGLDISVVNSASVFLVAIVTSGKRKVKSTKGSSTVSLELDL
uniref:Uncharacterized protein n=1 Tax=Glossina austeni TaxID=7395 RepID=A0A1A9UCU2_GLOAU